jgi:hypothetical protein
MQGESDVEPRASRAEVPPDVSREQRKLSEITKQIRKRRWMGLADEAQSTADAAGVLPNPVDAERPRSSAPPISTTPSQLTR